LDSSAVLVQAASGLHKYMSGTTGIVLKDSTVAQISAAVYYQSKVMSKLTTNKQFQEKFRSVIFSQIQKDFGEYIDAQARLNPSTLHHVYEWKKTGSKNARLFTLDIKESIGLSFRIGYSFKDSKSMVPTNYGNSRHVFRNKARVMEAGEPVVIRPRAAERLVFEIDGRVIRMPKGAPVTVKKPGGGKATNRFQIAYARFFTSNLVNLSIKKSGFQQIFNSSVTKAMRLPVDIKKVKYSFSPNTVDMQASSAVSTAFGGIS
jgi:hypothetical protein